MTKRVPIPITAAILCVAVLSGSALGYVTRSTPRTAAPEVSAGPSEVTASPTTTTPTPVSVTETPALDAVLSETDWPNVDYAPYCGLLVGEEPTGPLIDGSIDMSTNGFVGINLGDVVYVDLTGDGTNEAVVWLSCTPSAGTVLHDVRVFEATPDGPSPLGQPIATYPTGVSDGVIIGQTPVYGPNDPRCCPSSYQEERYTFDAARGTFELSTTPLAPSQRASELGLR